MIKTFKRKVYLITGPVKSGKTTFIMNTFRSVKNLSGIYAPVIDGKRFAYSIHSRRLILLEADDKTPADDRFSTKNYIFSQTAFSLVRDEIKIVSEMKTEWVIIDEIGNFELSGGGYEPAFTNLLSTLYDDQNLVLIVRDSLVKEVQKKYELNFQKLPEQII